MVSQTGYLTPLKESETVLTPDLNYGSYSSNIRRKIYGNSIQREDGLSSEDLLNELKTIVVSGTYKSNMVTQFGSAAYLIEHGGVEYVIDLNQPLLPIQLKRVKLMKTEIYLFINTILGLSTFTKKK